MKYLAILQNELATILEPIRNSVHNFDDQTKMKLLSKLENIQQHSKIVSSWIYGTHLNEELVNV